MQQKFIESTLALIDFISDSPSCFHAVENIGSILKDSGFKELSEKEEYSLVPGKNYFVKRNGSALIAFKLPKAQPSSLKIISSHTDSPTFKIKSNPEVKGLYTTLNVEAYGGMLISPWFDRPLSIAGRAFVKGKQVLVDIDKDLCSIVNLCIHHNRDANKGHEYKIQKELLPIICGKSDDFSLNALIAETLEVSENDIQDCELFLYNRENGKLWGLDNEFFSSPKIDNLMCAFSSVNALINSKPSDSIQMICLFDNEEVGSQTKQGADSDFFVQTVRRIFDSLSIGYQKQCMIQASSMVLSADNGHSFHPNYPEANDITNKPVMNGGVLIKYAGNQKYSTDAQSASVLKTILDKANVPYQIYHNNSNLPGGSTLGNISQSQISIPTVDIGAAQLAMHSPYETAGTMDTWYLTEGMKAFLE